MPPVPWNVATALFVQWPLIAPSACVQLRSAVALQTPAPPSITPLSCNAVLPPSQTVSVVSPNVLIRFTWLATDVCTNRSIPGSAPPGTVPNVERVIRQRARVVHQPVRARRERPGDVEHPVERQRAVHHRQVVGRSAHHAGRGQLVVEQRARAQHEAAGGERARARRPAPDARHPPPSPRRPSSRCRRASRPRRPTPPRSPPSDRR